MGCCGSREQVFDDGEELDTHSVCVGKNRSLLQEKLRWTADYPMTEGQLRSKRDEFWETAPMFDGRKEIWDALRAAASNAEQGDFSLAQAIIDGANISLPNGTLTETYDELGNRYVVPIYCLSHPLNMIEDRSESSVASAVEVLSSVDVLQNLDLSCHSADKRPRDSFPVLFRISLIDKDIEHYLEPDETIYAAKYRLHLHHSDQIPSANNQRWYFAGRLLSDRSRPRDVRLLQSNCIVQVVGATLPQVSGTGISDTQDVQSRGRKKKSKVKCKEKRHHKHKRKSTDAKKMQRIAEQGVSVESDADAQLLDTTVVSRIDLTPRIDAVPGDEPGSCTTSLFQSVQSVSKLDTTCNNAIELTKNCDVQEQTALLQQDHGISACAVRNDGLFHCLGAPGRSAMAMTTSHDGSAYTTNQNNVQTPISD